MPYLNMDDNYPEHPKVDGLSDAAFRLHTSALFYCARHLTDGHVDESKVQRLVPKFRSAAVNELVEARMWIKTRNGYRLHDYLQWNKSKAWWTAKREADAKRKAEWREKHRDD